MSSRGIATGVLKVSRSRCAASGDAWKHGAVIQVPCPLLGPGTPPPPRPAVWSQTHGSPFLPFSQDDDRCEEWERHEALHEDVTRQERTTERLFEEEIELKWEKGGSGLVFYTDAQFWQEEEGGKACGYCGEYQR